MFTGIIESVGEIKSIVQNQKNIDMEILSPISGELRVDESISHNGVCLTVHTIKKNNANLVLSFDVSKETL